MNFKYVLVIVRAIGYNGKKALTASETESEESSHDSKKNGTVSEK